MAIPEYVTLQDVLLKAMAETGDKPDDLVCFYQDYIGNPDEEEWRERNGKPGTAAPVIRCRFDELPTEPVRGADGSFRPMWENFDGARPLIAFSDRFAYFRYQFEGSVRMVAIPRHPEHVTSIPWVGSG